MVMMICDDEGDYDHEYNDYDYMLLVTEMNDYFDP